jgi:hypothetical protein
VVRERLRASRQRLDIVFSRIDELAPRVEAENTVDENEDKLIEKLKSTHKFIRWKSIPQERRDEILEVVQNCTRALNIDPQQGIEMLDTEQVVDSLESCGALPFHERFDRSIAQVLLGQCVTDPVASLVSRPLAGAKNPAQGFKA